MILEASDDSLLIPMFHFPFWNARFSLVNFIFSNLEWGAPMECHAYSKSVPFKFNLDISIILLATTLSKAYLTLIREFLGPSPSAITGKVCADRVHRKLPVELYYDAYLICICQYIGKYATLKQDICQISGPPRVFIKKVQSTEIYLFKLM